jgi:ABC-type nitrate/sulfonate/bicarbonate transport system substrate-binding protein
MVSALQSGDIDIGIGLTEGWIAALSKAQSQHQPSPFKLVGTYVETPLCWAISTGTSRSDLTSEKDLKGKKVGVSRIGSGSYVMSFVLAEKKGWLKEGDGEPPFPVEVLDTFANLREGVNKGMADFFMWEHFTSKRYYTNGAIKRIGEIYTPWSSWKIVARNDLLSPPLSPGSEEPHPSHSSHPRLNEELEDVLQKINKGVKHFEENTAEAVQYISTQLDYEEEDAREWLKTVRFAHDVRGVDRSVVERTVGILRKAGVVEEGVDVDEMIGLPRSGAVKWV